jgi:hypothetical protein
VAGNIATRDRLPWVERWREARCRSCESVGLFPTSAFGIMPLYEKRRRAASNEACLNRVRDWFCGANDQRRGKKAVPQSNDHITLQASA